MVHPSARIRGSASRDLDGRRIVLAITGSIAAVKCVELARELIRHGAHVLPVMTPAATRIVTADAIEFATGVRPVTALSGAVEHVSAFGEGGDADLLLIAPATANTIAKVALGIDDTALTTYASVALGNRRPILIAPAMHAPMEENPATQSHIAALKEQGVTFVRPLHEEGKAKLAPTDEIVDAVRRALGPQTWRGQQVLIVSGPSEEAIDTVRVVTNRSSGTTGLALAREAHRLGAAVTVVTSQPEQPWPADARVSGFQGVGDLLQRLEALLRDEAPDWIFLPAALSDYAPSPQPRKMRSDAGDFGLELRPLPKVLPQVRAWAPQARLVAWKLQDTLDEAITAAKGRLSDYRAEAFVANGTSALGGADSDAALVLPDAVVPLGHGSKEDLVRTLLAELGKRLQRP